jgi:hypothetical protein
MLKRFRVEIEIEANIDDSLPDGKREISESLHLTKQFIHEFAKGSDELTQFYANYFLDQFISVGSLKDHALMNALNYQKDNCKHIFIKGAAGCSQEIKDHIFKIHQDCEKGSDEDYWQDEQLQILDSFFGPLRTVKANFYEVNYNEEGNNK